jgi:hypothetical protein
MCAFQVCIIIICLYVAALFPYEMIHLGGDEVSYTCWELSAEIKAWQRSQGLQGSEGYVRVLRRQGSCHRPGPESPAGPMGGGVRALRQQAEQ